MRSIFTFLFSICLIASAFCQAARQQISLKDGSILLGNIEGITTDSLVKIRLSDSTLLEIPQALLWQVGKKRKDFRTLSSSAKVLSRGKYTSVGVHTLSAKKSQVNFEEEREMRWGMGFHCSFGYQFSPALAVGGGTGLDMPDQIYSPVFAEARGVFVKKTKPLRQINIQAKQKQQLRWMGGYFAFEPDTTVTAIPGVKTVRSKQQIALCYALQAGFYFPWGEVFDDNNNDEDWVRTRPGLMFYPSLGLAFPAASGTIFQVDFGYKFQRHTATLTFPSDTYRIHETYNLNSFAMRAGWTF